ncbi:MAG: hypothetical protein KF862_07230 [Chitinophagaceae bacterium]|nr:hypothetical protein [Chitinophagaceae bacterium]
MKIAILFVALVIGAVRSNAQSATIIPLTAGDTVSNGGAASKVIRLTAGYSGVVIQAKATKVSGTVAGNIKVQGSLDGSNWDTLTVAQSVTDVASQTRSFYISAPVPVFLRVIHTGYGTMSSILSVRYVARRYNQ